MNRFCPMLAGCVTALALSSAHATLVSRDLYDPGDALLTLDTETGLQWLDFTVCPGSTLGDFWSGACGLEALGFRTVSESELHAFAEHAGVTELGPTFTSANYAAVQLMRNLDVLPLGSPALFGVDQDNDAMPALLFHVDDKLQIAAVEEIAALAIHPEFSLERIALVRAVPLPAGGLLLGTAMAALGGLFGRPDRGRSRSTLTSRDGPL